MKTEEEIKKQIRAFEITLEYPLSQHHCETVLARKRTLVWVLEQGVE